MGLVVRRVTTQVLLLAVVAWLILAAIVVRAGIRTVHPVLVPRVVTTATVTAALGEALVFVIRPGTYTPTSQSSFSRTGDSSQLSHALCSGGFECRLLLDHSLIFLDELTHPSTCLATLHFSSSFSAGGFECRLLHLMTCKFSCNSELQHYLPHNPPFELRHAMKPPTEPSPQKTFMIPLLWS